MIDYTIYYDRVTRSWHGFWKDKDGMQLHDSIFAYTKNEVLIELGASRDQMIEVLREEGRG